MTDGRMFLLDQMLASERHERPRWYGMSSQALVKFAAGMGPRPRTPGHPSRPGGAMWLNEECGENYPHDMADLDACELAYKKAPAWMQRKMLPVLREFRDWVLDGKNRYGDVVGVARRDAS